MKINCETEDGGAVEFNKVDGVWASYSVAGVGGLPVSPLLYAGANLKDGRSLQFFFNRDTNLAVLDVIDKDGNGGCEVFRRSL